MARGSVSAFLPRDDAGAPAAKKMRPTPPEPQELPKGTQVFYQTDKLGVVREAWEPIDEFWVENLESGEVVRDVEGDAIAFKAKDLRLLMKDAPAAAERPPSQSTSAAPSKPPAQGSTARVLVLAKEDSMVQMLEHFGFASHTKRKEPQLVLAIPVASCRCAPNCKRFDARSMDMCSPDTCPFLQIAMQGTDAEDLQALASRLRPDLEMRTRVHLLKQAVEQIGPDLRRLDGYFCLSAVTMPYSNEEINKARGTARDYRENVCCQIDLGVSAVGVALAGDVSLEAAARRALRDGCRVDLDLPIWTAEAQRGLRQKLGVDLPLEFWDSDTKVFVVIIPEDATSKTGADGVLCLGARQSTQDSFGRAAVDKPLPSGREGNLAGDWWRRQDEFKHLGKLPKPWIFVRSLKDKEVIYFWNMETQERRVERPLPPGWTKHKSKTTGKVYFFHAEKKASTFEYPAPE